MNTDKPIHQCIKDRDEICVNCRYYGHHGSRWGIRCSHPDKRDDKGLPKTIPSRYHHCEMFEFKPANSAIKIIKE